MMILFENMTLRKSIYTDPYIHGREEDVRWTSGDFLLTSRQTQATNVLSRYIGRLRQSIKSITNVQTGELIDVSTLSDDTLVSLMNQMAMAMNENVQAQIPQVSNKMLAAISGAQINANFYENGKVNNQKLYAMLDSIFSALELVTNTQISAESRLAFSKIYRDMFNRRFSQARLGKEMTALVSSWNIQQGADIVAKVIEQLRDIPHNLIDKNGRFTDSVKGTLRNAMNTTIGESLGVIFSDIGMNVNRSITNTFSQATGSKTSQYNQWEGSGAQRKTIGKTDVYSNHGITIQTTLLQPGNNQYFIEGQLNSSVKWYANEKISGNVINPLSSKIKIANHNSLIQWIEKIYGMSPSSMYGVYNTLAWKNSGAAAANYKIFKTSILQTNMDLFLAGKGTQMFGGPGLDLSAFLLINGEFYSIAGILAIVQKELMDSQKNILTMSLSNTKQAEDANEWQGDRPNILKAYKRSAAAKAALNRLGFSVTLNGPALQKSLSNPIFNSAKLTIP